MWQGQDVVLSLWLAVKNKTVMADAKAAMLPRTSLICLTLVVLYIIYL